MIATGSNRSQAGVRQDDLGLIRTCYSRVHLSAWRTRDADHSGCVAPPEYRRDRGGGGTRLKCKRVVGTGGDRRNTPEWAAAGGAENLGRDV